MVRRSSIGSRKKFLGARMRRSASSAISSARCRARSDSPPHAFAWIRQAMRRKRNCLWLDRDCSPKTSRYFSLNFPAVRLRRPSISARISISVFIALTRSPMRALCLREVKFPADCVREEHAYEGGAENGSDLTYSLIERGIVIAHERSPLETTHDDFRFAVDAPSGGLSTRFRSPRPLTIYAENVENVRVGDRLENKTGAHHKSLAKRSGHSS